MKVALISNIYGHGKILQEIGTPLLLVFEGLEKVDELDIYTHVETEKNVLILHKARIIPTINPERPITYLKLLRDVARLKYDRVIINSMPTSQGNKNVPNLLYLILPILWSRIYGLRILILYHNSPFLNDIRKLGYVSLKNKVKSWIIKMIERRMYFSCDVFFLLELYAERIRKIIPNARVSFLEPGSITGFTTLHLNQKLDSDIIKRIASDKNLTLLIYGSWGPQKDISKALDAIRMLRVAKWKFKTVVAGDINLHFPNYEKELENTLKEYKDFIDKRVGYVSEYDLYSLFSSADVIILPYVTPGGFSGVLSISMLFGLEVIVPEFDEYKKQTKGYGRVHFIPKIFEATDIVSEIENILETKLPFEGSSLFPRKEFQDFMNRVSNILNQVT